MRLELEVKFAKIPLTDGTAQAVVLEELRAATEAGVLMVQGEILPRTPVDRGILRQGVQTEVVGDRAEVQGRVFDPVGHALSVESGAAAHWPPRDAIEGWVERKGIASGKDVRAVAFLIARAISRRGTRPRLMFKDGLAAARGRVLARYALANTRIVQRLGGRS